MSTPLPRRAALRSAAAAVVVLASGPTAACSLPGGTEDREDGDERDEREDQPHELRFRPPGTAGAVDPAGPKLDEVTAAASRALLDRASTVVVSSAEDAEVEAGVAAALHLGVPLLVAGPALAGELDRLATRTVIRYAARAPRSPAPSSGPDELGDREVVEGTAVADLPDLPGLPATPRTGAATVLLRAGTPLPPALEPWLHLAGSPPVEVGVTDVRTSTPAREALTSRPDGPVLALGAGFGEDHVLAQRVRTTAHAPELPGGGLLPFPDRMMVALYGHPLTAALGMLGEQKPAEAVKRATELAEEYAALTDTRVVPAFELIATVASVSQQDGSYSNRTKISTLLPWIEAAEEAGLYVVLDLQPGRSDFLTQAKAYEELLRRPWVGLALDPEWRLRPDQVHLTQIGSVGIEEVNEVGAWLAGIVRDHDLPPKVLTLHQFNLRMIRDRERLDTSLDEIQWLLHADGQGSQGAKQETWTALRRTLPEGVWLGWKNFEDEDQPMLTVEQTMDRVDPRPSFISYQ
ncbi:hypothetical protein [Knoellia aerolata]|uniref:Lipoprotein n=1 Tax=Knoellia aerolata DSM 18566 TaxID=1385519 RepID=A0A0A0JTJ2_9MICO|nr:hypothetical protein [Knoellia aerolata]KGN40750.1 hypothetical protein N801_12410 [Knoellia aerolata DSM 18566]